MTKKSINIGNINYSYDEVLSSEELEASLRDQKEHEKYIHYVLGNRQTLLRVCHALNEKKTMIFHCNIPHGRPLTHDVSDVIKKVIPQGVINDLSRSERAPALFNPGGFSALQDVRSNVMSLPEGIEKLARQNVDFAVKAGPGFGLFDGRTESDKSIPTTTPSKRY